MPTGNLRRAPQSVAVNQSTCRAVPVYHSRSLLRTHCLHASLIASVRPVWFESDPHRGEAAPGPFSSRRKGGIFRCKSDGIPS